MLTNEVLNCKQDVRTLINRVFEILGESHLGGSLDLEWSQRMTSCAGRGGYRRETKRGIIKISEKLWDVASPEERAQLVIHEACHVVQRYQYPWSQPHGSEWRGMMWKCGRKARIHHKIDTSKVKNGRRVAAECPCGAIKDLGKIRAERIRQGKRRYYCGVCKKQIILKNG